MKDLYVLDACALIAYFREEAGSEVVSARFIQASNGAVTILIHKVTFTEVVYDALRTDKQKTFLDVRNDVSRLPVTIVESLTDALVEQAALFKATHRISFADCFALALAKINHAKVITSDHHEFDAVEKSGEVKFEWIR